MTRIKEYIKDSEDGVGGDPSNHPVRTDIIDMINKNTTKSVSPSGHPHFGIDDEKVLEYIKKG